MSGDRRPPAPSAETRPLRRLIRVPGDFHCEVVADGLALEGRTVDLNERGMGIVLPEPLFARLDSTTIVLTRPDGSLVKMAGRVIRQHRIGVGAVLVGIQLAELPVDATTVLIEKCAPASPVQLETAPVPASYSAGLRGWWRMAGYRPPQSPDRRRIPRLPIHTRCAILGDGPELRGLTRDLSYTGLSAWFRHFEPGRLWGALLRIKFVTVKAMPIGIEHRGPETLVRFRIDQIHEGEERWRDLHYSYWRHLA
jgi:hypothetical protein